ncbi:GntP family permease [Chengkuizengella axinellae]|uniref:GntP family permease n=1 Tax=Chengkuizengella axinellae TaxID=3064388 RepID=A0ABT9J3Q8_9BACL|nr:GntP family permease [Chengkuizengella sp. 2205SS18-9]MDP5275625.1 GntP family permease [Chengkuizengella sp. 2205SS18-9]
MDIWEVIVIFISLALLIVLALRGFSIIIIAPLASLVVILFTGMPILGTLQDSYMAGFVSFAGRFYLIFLFASMFGKFMEDSGAAKKIALSIMKVTGKAKKLNVILAIVLISAVLTYGGVSVFVAIFAIMPIARPLFKELDIPWTLFVGVFFFGTATFTMTMLPGTPAIQNIIPTQYFGTTTMAAPLVGIVAAITVILFNIYYLKRQLKKAEERGEGYGVEDDDVEEEKEDSKQLPPIWLSLLPPIFLLIVLNIMKLDVVYTLILSVVFCMPVFWKYIDSQIKTLNQGAVNTVLPIVNTSADVGYGTVIAATAGFAVLSGALASLPGSPLISLYGATTLLAGVTGSASGGLGIAMEVLGEQYLALGVAPEALHRIASIAAGGFDALPHNGAVITALAIAGLTHRKAYKHIFFTTVVGPVIAAVPAIILAIMIY